jgi:hypothetical protein
MKELKKSYVSPVNYCGHEERRFGCVGTQEVSSEFPPWRSDFDHRSGHVGFTVDKLVLRQGFF